MKDKNLWTSSASISIDAATLQWMGKDDDPVADINVALLA
jgi:hypothetical protein